jgi:hypothetical protein
MLGAEPTAMGHIFSVVAAGTANTVTETPLLIGAPIELE